MTDEAGPQRSEQSSFLCLRSREAAGVTWDRPEGTGTARLNSDDLLGGGGWTEISPPRPPVGTVWEGAPG